MATRQLYIDGANGTVSIVNYANATNARTDPLNNIDDVYFHTSLPYIQLKQTINSTSVTLSAKSREYYDTAGGCNGCFITQACISAMNLADDDLLLQTLRNFRDKYMLSKFETANLVATYYLEAPQLVQKLDELPNKLDIYKSIYTNYLVPAVSAINTLQYKQAVNIYTSLFNYVKKLVENK